MGIIVAIIRIISLVLIAAALMALGYDAFSWYGDHAHQLTSLQAAGIKVGAPESMFTGWPGFLQPLLGLPAFLVLGVTGIVLAIITKIAHRN